MTKISCYAPVIIPTLCRYDHFVKCVSSLKNNVESEYTDLIIGLDYPSKESHREGYEKIKEYIDNLTGFNKIVVFRHSHNLGVIKNESFLLKYVRENYDRYIYSEDDNEFSPNFLQYINKGLEKYKKDPRVYSISGYNYPIDMSGYAHNVYAYSACSEWGTGYWVDKNINDSIEDIRKAVKNPLNLLKIYRCRPKGCLSVLSMLNMNQNYGDLCKGTALILKDMVSIFPKVSKVRNHGHDGSGENCGNNQYELFEKQEIDINIAFDYDDIDLKSISLHSLNEYLSISNKAKLLILFYYMKFWVNIIVKTVFCN